MGARSCERVENADNTEVLAISLVHAFLAPSLALKIGHVRVELACSNISFSTESMVGDIFFCTQSNNLKRRTLGVWYVGAIALCASS
jgi:hypothetical protein